MFECETTENGATSADANLLAQAFVFQQSGKCVAQAVRVIWPDGRSEEWRDVPIDRYTTLTEGAGK